MDSMRRLSTKQLAQRWSMQPRTIARWCRDGRLKGEKWGRVWRVTEKEIKRFEARHGF